MTRLASPALVFEFDGAGHWADGSGAELPDLAGCVDVDIAVTPFTNTLPIRRLPWQPGRARDLLMVYLAVRRDLKVDAEGLVIDYPGFWRRVGERA